MGHTTIGIFENSSDAYQAVEELTNSGFSRSEIDLVENQDPDQVTSEQVRKEEEEDSFSRFFNNLFGNKDEARSYSEVSRRSSSIVTVHAQTYQEAQRAAHIMDDHGAIDARERAAQYGYNTPHRAETDKDQTIPVIEEEMKVGKRDVVTGGARVRSRIVEKPVEETIRLRQEKVNVERKPVNRPASEEDLKRFKEGDLTAIERSEEAVVDKEARVVEEVKLNKEVEHKEETVRENVKKTEVDIENQNKDWRNSDLSDDDYSDRDKGY